MRAAKALPELADQVVLGLCAFTHDSSAALVRGGKLLGFVEEERLSGDKHTKAYPKLAVEWLLAEAGLAAGDVSAVAYNFAGHRFLRGAATSLPLLTQPVTARRALPRLRSFLKVHANYRQRMRWLREWFPNATVQGVAHHQAHGLYAFAASGYDQAAVLVIDSLGETQTTTTWRALQTRDGVAFELAGELRDPQSLGYAYGAVTEHLGWRRGDEEGTVMALAALGDPARFRAVLREGIKLSADGFRLDPRLFPVRVLSHRYPRVSPEFIAATCPPRHVDEPVEQVHADLAAALQERTEQVLDQLAFLAFQQTGQRRLCLAGGVAMNCVAVGRVATNGLIERVFVPPAPGDAGTAIGAAAALSLARGGRLPTGLGGCYLGPSYPPEQAQRLARARGLHCRQLDYQPADFLARQLAAGKIIGVFQGRVEAGPRALGNRSILASPLVPGIVERLNQTVKFREPFRPFAPVVLADQARDWFRLPYPSPHMAIAVPATTRATERIGAVVHRNGTARVQTVEARQNPLLAETLAAFAARTGIPVLINTSLNVKGKPICGTPEMALDCLAATGLDGLYLEGSWVTR